MNNQPQYFSDHFNIDKAKLKELGVFDPILNFDTKVFVEPLLLKKSSNEIIKKSANTFDQFFIDLLTLIKISQEEGDKPWRQAKRIVKVPEYKYTCIGYGTDSINGSGSGAELNEKILQSAKEIVKFAKDNPHIFLILPLLEEGVGADIISDMTQNIIDEDICNFTTDIMQKIGLVGNCKHRAKNRLIYDLPYNPFSKCPVKLLPDDILSDLPLADSFDDWLVNNADINSDLRASVNKHIGDSWIESNKAQKKEQVLNLLKNDKPFFVQVLETLKNYDFSHYNLEEDYQGLHRWLKDSEKFIKFKPSDRQIGFLDDDLEKIFLAVGEIINHFKQSIEDEELWRIFWTQHYSKLTHVKEFYSQMLFYMVASSWINSKDNNLSCVRSLNKQSKQIDFKFSVLGKYSVNVMVKHSDNYNGLEKGYSKKVKNSKSRLKEKDFYIVMNFNVEKSKQLEAIKKSEEEGFKIIEVDVAEKDNREGIFDFEAPNLEFDNMLTEFEDMPNIDNQYFTEKSKGGKKRHEKTDIIKNNIIKPMFANTGLIKGTSTQQRADKISEIISNAFDDEEDKEKLPNFAKIYNLDYETLEQARGYFKDSKSERIYKWCLEFSKQAI